MDTKSNLLLYLASRLPDTLVEEKAARSAPSRQSEETVSPEVIKLKQRLQAIREQSLIACRKGDYRTQARLTGEAARVAEALRKAEGLPMFSEAD